MLYEVITDNGSYEITHIIKLFFAANLKNSYFSSREKSGNWRVFLPVSKEKVKHERYENLA